MDNPHTVAALCVSPRSIYKRLEGVECYDSARDVRTFAGGMPVVAHPPCRAWSAYLRHQAKPLPGEKELGPLCVDWLRKCGGVLEHPAHSRLFAHCGLPLPGKKVGSLWTIEVEQSMWGDSRRKLTWLCFAGVRWQDVVLPLTLHSSRRGDRQRWKRMSHAKRAATPPAMAAWLVAVARVSELERG